MSVVIQANTGKGPAVTVLQAAVECLQKLLFYPHLVQMSTVWLCYDKPILYFIVLTVSPAKK